MSLPEGKEEKIWNPRGDFCADLDIKHSANDAMTQSTRGKWKAELPSFKQSCRWFYSSEHLKEIP